MKFTATTEPKRRGRPRKVADIAPAKEDLVKKYYAKPLTIVLAFEAIEQLQKRVAALEKQRS